MPSVTGSLLLIPLFFLVFGLSATVDVRAAWRERERYKRGVVCGLCCQFVLLPFIGFCVVKAFDLGELVGVTLLVVTSSPGGSYSNFWCSILNADLALSVAMTAASTVLSVAFLPLNLLIWVNLAYARGATSDLRWEGLFAGIAVVILAVGAGLLASYALEDGAKASRAARARNAFNTLGQVSGLALMAASALVSSRDEPIWDKKPSFYVACATPFALGLLLSLAAAKVARLEGPERCAVAVECAYQNPGIATTVALNMFEGDRASRAVGVPLYYGIVEAFGIGVFLLVAWKRGMTHAPADAPLLAVLRKNWQEINKQEAAARDVEVPPPASPVGGDAGVEAAAAVDDVAVDDVAVEPAAPLVAAPDEGPEAQDACAVA